MPDRWPVWLAEAGTFVLRKSQTARVHTVKTKFRFLTMIVLSLFVSTATANVFVPDGLNPGDEYHLVFVTDGTIDALSADISVYNDFVQAEAALNPSLTGTDMGVTYSAIVSTPTVHARDNALIEAPVYLVDGTLLGSGFGQMWDGNVHSPINQTQSLTTIATAVWTGTFFHGGGTTTRALGTDSGFAIVGSTLDNGPFWINNSGEPVVDINVQNPLYALSSKLTVAAAVPEPTSFIVLIGLGLAGVCRRRYRIA